MGEANTADSDDRRGLDEVLKERLGTVIDTDGHGSTR